LVRVRVCVLHLCTDRALLRRSEALRYRPRSGFLELSGFNAVHVPFWGWLPPPFTYTIPFRRCETRLSRTRSRFVDVIPLFKYKAPYTELESSLMNRYFRNVFRRFSDIYSMSCS